MSTVELVTERLEKLEFEEDCCEILSSVHGVVATLMNALLSMLDSHKVTAAMSVSISVIGPNDL